MLDPTIRFKLNTGCSRITYYPDKKSAVEGIKTDGIVAAVFPLPTEVVRTSKELETLFTAAIVSAKLPSFIESDYERSYFVAVSKSQGDLVHSSYAQQATTLSKLEAAYF